MPMDGWGRYGVLSIVFYRAFWLVFDGWLSIFQCGRFEKFTEWLYLQSS